MSKVFKGKVIRIYPNNEQKIKFAKCFGSTRWLWNQILEMETKRLKNGASFINQEGLNYILAKLKEEYPWLKEVEPTCLINVNQKISNAFSKYFNNKMDYPKYKHKRNEQSFTIKCAYKNIEIIDNHHIRLPTIGSIYYRSSPIPKGDIRNVTVRLLGSGKYTASILFETEIDKLPKTNKVCGIDLGLKNLITLSDGNKFPLPRFDKELEDKLVYWQRCTARRLSKAKEVMKTDKSKTLLDFKNYQKARQMVAKYNEKIANQREYYLHTLSKWIVTNYDVIILEDLKSKEMLKNHKLARAITNAGWNRLIEMIKYKCKWYEKRFIQVSSAYTSQTCNKCGYINKRLGYSQDDWLNIRTWKCPECGTYHDRDINAAINIRNKGLTQLM